MAGSYDAALECGSPLGADERQLTGVLQVAGLHDRGLCPQLDIVAGQQFHLVKGAVGPRTRIPSILPLGPWTEIVSVETYSPPPRYFFWGST